MPTRRDFLNASLLFPVAGALLSGEPERSFSVFTLLRPTVLSVSPIGSARLHCATAWGRRVIEQRQRITLDRNDVPIAIAGPDGGRAPFLLEVPGVMRRSYYGRLHVARADETLLPVITMQCEIAAGSIAGAELATWAAPIDALAAQAVVSRSILIASKPRHKLADFCDTTHCQFLRSPAEPGSATARAIEQTAGTVLSQDGRPLIPLYSAACGGTTDAVIDRGQRYTSVNCEICRRNRTARRGHGWGLCQEGAVGLARLGWSWQAILHKYFPDATIERFSSSLRYYS
ncbi:MAG: hypothetical protein JOZ62_07245 [Acidobacteriaceae bacterium]|nr:hypothetical protein [Acidobacteriaceae bacterium]